MRPSKKRLNLTIREKNFLFDKLEINKVEDIDKAILLKLKEGAKKLEDTSLVVYSYIDIGDFYLNQFNNKEALRSYMLAKTLSGVDIDLDKIIEQKLSRIKIAIGQDEYENLIKDIKKFRWCTKNLLSLE